MEEMEEEQEVEEEEEAVGVVEVVEVVEEGEVVVAAVAEEEGKMELGRGRKGPALLGPVPSIDINWWLTQLPWNPFKLILIQ